MGWEQNSASSLTRLYLRPQTIHSLGLHREIRTYIHIHIFIYIYIHVPKYMFPIIYFQCSLCVNWNEKSIQLKKRRFKLNLKAIALFTLQISQWNEKTNSILTMLKTLPQGLWNV